MNKYLLVSIIALGSTMIAGCDNISSSNTVEHQKAEQLQSQAVASVGMPGIINFFEKRLLKTILEMRDDPKLTTYTYEVDMQGKYHLRCHSIGYGLDGATQFTNPQQIVTQFSGHDGVAISQADPNGLYSPSTSLGTWVLCHDPKSDKNYPVRFENNVDVSPFELPTD